MSWLAGIILSLEGLFFLVSIILISISGFGLLTRSKIRRLRIGIINGLANCKLLENYCLLTENGHYTQQESEGN